MASFVEVMEAISRWFDDKRHEVKQQGDSLQQAIQKIQQPGDTQSEHWRAELDSMLNSAHSNLSQRYDEIHGGYGAAPKFPQGPLLTSIPVINPDDESLEVSLLKMSASGLRDHLDDGFFRYCVDATWTIPHFEKMLYDNALLLKAYCLAARNSRQDDIQRILTETAQGVFQWLEDTMRQDNGAYSASIDADADGKEGAFHVWTPDQVREILAADVGDDEAALFIAAYGLDSPPNFENEAWHLVQSQDIQALDDQQRSSLRRSKASLRAMREKRVHPTLDEKQLTSWNALVAGALVSGASVCQQKDAEKWLDRALQVFTFLRKEAWKDDALLAVHNQGESRFVAYLDDIAFLLDALVDYLQQRWDRDLLTWALQLANCLVKDYQDSNSGGFYFTREDANVPLARSLNFHDDATPNGNAAAALALHRLGHLSGEVELIDAAERCFQRASSIVRENPLACSSMLASMATAAKNLGQVIIGGKDEQAQLALQQWLRENYAVDCYVIGSNVDGLPGTLGSIKPGDSMQAWLCRDGRCMAPVSTRRELTELLEQD